MNTKLFIGAALGAITLISLAGAASAQQGVRAQRQTVVNEGNFAPNTPVEEASCRIYRTWMTESGLVFHCDGLAMVFDGGNQSGGIAAAAAMLLQFRSDELNVFVRYQMDPNNSACAEIRYTRYANMFEHGQCARAISFGY